MPLPWPEIGHHALCAGDRPTPPAPRAAISNSRGQAYHKPAPSPSPNDGSKVEGTRRIGDNSSPANDKHWMLLRPPSDLLQMSTPMMRGQTKSPQPSCAE